jgi:hypothetical protein
MKTAGWVRILIFAFTLILINVVTMWVSNSNLIHGLYGIDGDISETPNLYTLFSTILISPVLLIIGFLPFSHFIQRWCSQNGQMIGTLLLTIYALSGFLGVLGLVYWSDRFHYLISLVYLLALLVLARCYWNDTRRLLGLGFKKWFGVLMILLAVSALVFLVAENRFYDEHGYDTSPDKWTERVSLPSTLPGFCCFPAPKG